MAQTGWYPQYGASLSPETVMPNLTYASEIEALQRTILDKVVNPKDLDAFNSNYILTITNADVRPVVVSAATHGFDNANIVVKVYEVIDINTRNEIDISVSVNPNTFDVSLNWITPFNWFAVLTSN